MTMTRKEMAQIIEVSRKLSEMKSLLDQAETLAGLTLAYLTNKNPALVAEIVRLSRLLAPAAPPIERADFTVPGPGGEMQNVAFRNAPLLQDTGADLVHPHFVPVEPKP